MTSELWSKASIVGIGQTEFSKNSGRSNLQLSVEAGTAALADAGIGWDEVDGLVTSVVDSSDPSLFAETVGIREVSYFSQTCYGGGGICAGIRDAAVAIATGSARNVLVYRGMNGRSRLRYGQGYDDPARVTYMAFAGPYGNLTPAHQFSINVRRYMHEFDVTNADFAPVSVACRRHAATNPNAFFYGQPITTEDHDTSRWIVEPTLRLLDCCMESDGGVAVVVTSSDRARSLPNPPVVVTAASQGMVGTARLQLNYYSDDVSKLAELALVGRQLWDHSGLTPDDIDVALLYDHFSPLVLLQLEALGFCERGAAKHFVRDGNIELGGKLPVNTHGGMLGEAYVHGMNAIAEGVRQLRGTAVNQVRNAQHVVVTSGPGTPASGLVLSRPG